MPLNMDVHSLGSAVTFEDVGKAHQADLQAQGSYGPVAHEIYEMQEGS
jgi:hypothetical protein